MATAVVIGATGGIGGALVEELVRRGAHDRILALSRHPMAPAAAGIVSVRLDLKDEASIAAAAAQVEEADLVIVATAQQSRAEGQRSAAGHGGQGVGAQVASIVA